MHCLVSKPLRHLALFVLVFLLGTRTTPLHAQDAPARKLSWAAKVQAYQPLSWLAEPLNGEKDFPLTPRFWTGEVELGFSERSSVQVSVGVRRYRYIGHNEMPELLTDFRDGTKVTVAYRNYLLNKRLGTMKGLYIAPFFRWAKGHRVYDLGGQTFGEITTHSISCGANVGWQLQAGKHLVLDLQVGPEIGYQRPQSPFLEFVYGDKVTTLDYSGYINIWQKGTYNPQFVGIGLNCAFGIGWKF